MPFDYNIITYLIYTPLMVTVIYKVGMLCHRHGEVWTMELYQDEEFVKAVNRLLLLAYYLLNIGYAVTVISYWPQVNSFGELIATITTKSGTILLTLALLHYMNIGALTLWYNYRYKHYKL